MTVCGPLIGGAIGVIAILAASWFKPGVQLVFNPTESAPRGWYLITPAAKFRVGDYVVARIPNEAALVAAARGYLPLEVPLLKQVSAVAGMRVCTCNRIVYVEGVAIARALDIDSNGRTLANWQECRELATDELFLLNPSIRTSFDSRYFGPVKTTAVHGAVPLWTWSQP